MRKPEVAVTVKNQYAVTLDDAKVRESFGSPCNQQTFDTIQQNLLGEGSEFVRVEFHLDGESVTHAVIVSELSLEELEQRLEGILHKMRAEVPIVPRKAILDIDHPDFKHS